ncbi:MAG: hypothetical protein RLZ06_285 [Actinomycetota bacterium]
MTAGRSYRVQCPRERPQVAKVQRRLNAKLSRSVPPRAAAGREGAKETEREVIAFSAPEKNRTSAHGLGNHCSIH